MYRRVDLANQRQEGGLRDQLVSGEFCLNLRNRSFLKGSRPIELTQVEFQIMEYFFSHPGVALARGDILKHVWGAGYGGEEKIVDVNIRRLRMKVEEEPSNPQHIVTVWSWATSTGRVNPAPERLRRRLCEKGGSGAVFSQGVSRRWMVNTTGVVFFHPGGLYHHPFPDGAELYLQRHRALPGGPRRRAAQLAVYQRGPVQLLQLFRHCAGLH